MTDQNCTTDQYGNTGCIGTAVHAHSTIGDLPMTGLNIIPILAAVLAGLLLAILAIRVVDELRGMGWTLPHPPGYQRGGRILPPAETQLSRTAERTFVPGLDGDVVEVTYLSRLRDDVWGDTCPVCRGVTEHVLGCPEMDRPR